MLGCSRLKTSDPHLRDIADAVDDPSRNAAIFNAFPSLVWIAVMPYKGKNYRMSVIRDIRDRKDAQARIQFLAHHDTLTGLPNRARLMDRTLPLSPPS